jgi:hypothetical protein
MVQSGGKTVHSVNHANINSISNEYFLPYFLSRNMKRGALFCGVTQRRVVILYRHVVRKQSFTDTLSGNFSKGLPLDAA